MEDSTTIIPAQVRAARALLDWPQERLAQEAKVALTSVRDIEGEKRASEPATLASLQRAFENFGVEFLPGTPDNGGPGVRLSPERPNVIRRPTTIGMFDGMPIEVDYKGRQFTARISREAVEDLGRLRGDEPKDAWLKVFDDHQGAILNAIRRAFESDDRWDERGRLSVVSSHFPELAAPGIVTRRI